MKNRLQELDALRGIAALAVVFFHITMDKPQRFLGFNLGTTGVDLFFMISGFVILLSISHVKTSKEFIINRVGRLYPTYWASMIYSSCFLLAYFYATTGVFFRPTFEQFCWNLTMFQHFLHVENIDGTYWTLIIELLFYILILLIYFAKKMKYVVQIGFVLALVFTSINLFASSHTFAKILVDRLPVFYHLPLFFAGMTFYKIHTKIGSQQWNYFFIFSFMTLQLFAYPFNFRLHNFISETQYRFMIVLFFILFIGVVHNKLSYIVNKYTLFLGKISYCLYLTHQIVSNKIIIPYFLKTLNWNFWPTVILVVLPITISVAYCITQFIEIPANRWIRATFLKKKLKKDTI